MSSAADYYGGAAVPPTSAYAPHIKTFIGETPLSGIEYGFLSRIAQIAYCGSLN